ncbi:universal stress protein [Nonomuraea pusilla]|uniref:Nucleotide-binding universal stress protein, UspA family n=1 Tax=Nonomuraea pusilla TaxID=46177 RepID=A0A1H7X3K2_9ACTN|nr:universal stress protein [Nonomuraea pusilla]SEM27767.1 Nucleotide-binding universal stress protein, UspA family [Nonomuraea pusilla]
MIIVGVDGSRAGLDAVAWAAREAALRGVPLTVAYAMPRWAIETRSGRYADVAAWMRDGCDTVLAAGRERARREQPELEVVTAALPGDARDALTRAAEDAQLLVVGSHGVGGVRGMLIGSVAYGVTAHATCDVVVVRALPSLPRGEIVVGVDGSPRSRAVLEFAFAEAELRGAELRAVHAWAWPRPEGFDPADPESERDEQLVLKETLAGFGDLHPDVTVIEELVHGHPVEVLRQAAAGADLLIVGTRGYGTFAGMVLGSVSQAMLHESPCPLVVVRGDRPAL